MCKENLCYIAFVVRIHGFDVVKNMIVNVCVMQVLISIIIVPKTVAVLLSILFCAPNIISKWYARARKCQ